MLRLGLQAYALGIAYEFEPYFGLSISRVDPLPHQLEAVYEHLLKLPSVRFLLADDAGAGKTIMAGLLIRELKLRGLIERALVVCPANLAFQWQRELNEKFDEKFLVFNGFLMALYQRRLASSTYAMRRSLENRARRLAEGLKSAHDLLRTAPPDLPEQEEMDELEDAERERVERILEAITLAGNEAQVREEIAELRELAAEAQAVEGSGSEAKLAHLRRIMQDQGFFDRPDQRLLIFTEFKDTLDYLMEHLQAWGFKVGCIHGGMKPGSRDEPGTRLYAEQQFREGATQVLVATEAAGEGINLQCCHILFNCDIPWNPNRLEQRMGRIHRYGQRLDCLIFNFVATNTIEGRVLKRLLHKLQEIRDALDDDAVFNVVGEVLPSAHVERVLRDFYAGKLGDEDLEERLLKDVDEGHFRSICQNALEGLAAKKLNLDMLIERRARAQERRVVPETIARFIAECAKDAALDLKPVRGLAHAFDPARTPSGLKRYEREPGWQHPELTVRYPRLSTDRDTAEKQNLEWVTPGHPLFEALRRHSLDCATDELRLIEVKGLAGPTGSILLTPNERRVAEDRRDCYWLYVVTDCARAPHLQQPIPDPARYPWHEVTKVAHYYLSVNALKQPMEIRETERGYQADATP